MIDIREELARGERDVSPYTQLQRSLRESCVYVSPQPRTLANKRRPRVRHSVCLLLVVLAALFIITLAVSLFALIAKLLYHNALAFSSATTQLLPTTTLTPSTTYHFYSLHNDNVTPSILSQRTVPYILYLT